MTTIIDYNVGNIGSIVNMLKKLGESTLVSCDHSEILKAERLILPGVGSFDKGMSNLINLNLIEVLNEAILVKKKNILGICLGMQLMTAGSEEGRSNGLAWLDASTKKFLFPNNDLKIPHMGWNNVYQVKDSDLFNEMDEKLKFYFVHSYYVECNETDDILTTSSYGIDFVSSFKKENIWGVQFHPEKSHIYGLKLLKNFCKLNN